MSETLGETRACNTVESLTEGEGGACLGRWDRPQGGARVLAARTADDMERLSAYSENSGDEWTRTEKTSFWEPPSTFPTNTAPPGTQPAPGRSQARGPSPPDPLHGRPSPQLGPPDGLSLVGAQSPHPVPVFTRAKLVGSEPGCLSSTSPVPRLSHRFLVDTRPGGRLLSGRLGNGWFLEVGCWVRVASLPRAFWVSPGKLLNLLPPPGNGALTAPPLTPW